MEEVFYCPKCGSDDLYFDKRGFDSARAIRGALFFGSDGLWAGFLGSRQTVVVCNRCGCVCDASAAIRSRRAAFREMQKKRLKDQKNKGCIAFFILIIILIIFIFGFLILKEYSFLQQTIMTE